MAILSSDGTYVTVVQGDTLSQIAVDYGNGKTYQQIVAINNNLGNTISNPDLIYVGQIIYLVDTGTSTAKTSNKNRATIDQFGLLSNTPNTLFATWSWSKSKTESYKVVWTYDTGNGVWLVGNSASNTVESGIGSLARQSTYSIPSGARRVAFKVKPISKKRNKNGSQTSYWTAEWSNEKLHVVGTPLEQPGVPAVTLDKLTLTATVKNLETKELTAVEFEVVKDNATSRYKTARANIVNGVASYSCTVVPGGKYKVRCRGIRNGEGSEWTAYSEEVTAIPAAPAGITVIRAESETSVYLEWEPAATATSYDIEYTTKKEYFDISDQTTLVSDVETTKRIIEGLGYDADTNNTYFFRVRSVNKKADGDVNYSAWTEPKSVVIGTKPAAPTTWSSTTTAISGEDLYLYWVHNAEDGSRQSFAEISLDVSVYNEVLTWTLKDEVIDNNYITYIPLTEEEKKEGKNHSVYVKTDRYDEGTNIEWRVRTAGATKQYGDYSIPRKVDIYVAPTLDLTVTDSSSNALDTITSFPFYIRGVPGPKSQIPIGYHLSVKSDETYETTDSVGRDIVISAGEEVYSRYFDIFENQDENVEWATTMIVEFLASNIDLMNNISYTAVCTVSMDSGLTAESSVTFTVAWEDMEYEPNAEIGLDEETFTAYIRPYCEDGVVTTFKVTKTGDVYTKTTEEVSGVCGEEVVGVTIDEEDVYSGVDMNGNGLYFCETEIKTPITNVYLSVYRREFDGSFTGLASNLDGELNTTITDPHPSLDLARYRIVAIDKDTGSVSYYDTPGYPVGGKAAIIQWDESWSNFEVSEDDLLEQPAWAGSMLKLPYNIDVSDNMSPDVARIEYIGREHPIAYYGTQLGHSSSWSMEIEKSDKDTLYALRRLQRWMGDVYVREPSGSGYWANITVSFSQKHCELTIPVTLNVVRVEGGV